MIEVHRLKNIVIFIQRIINFYNTNTESEQLKVSKNSCHINIDNLKLLLQMILISFDFNSRSQLETRQMVKIPTLKANLLANLEKKKKFEKQNYITMKIQKFTKVNQDFEESVNEIAEDNQIQSKCQWYGKRRKIKQIGSEFQLSMKFQAKPRK